MCPIDDDFTIFSHTIHRYVYLRKQKKNCTTRSKLQLMKKTNTKKKKKIIRINKSKAKQMKNVKTKSVYTKKKKKETNRFYKIIARLKR